MTDKDTGDGKWKAEQGEGDLESMGGDGWSRQTSQTKQRLSNRKPEMNQPCSWEQGIFQGMAFQDTTIYPLCRPSL